MDAESFRNRTAAGLLLAAWRHDEFSTVRLAFLKSRGSL